MIDHYYCFLQLKWQKILLLMSVLDQFRADLEPHVLQGISEMSEIQTEKSAW